MSKTSSTVNKKKTTIVLALGAMLTILPLLSIGTFQTAEATSIFADFNCDGEEDLAIGIPDEDIGAVTTAGAVHVIYGDTNGGLSPTAAIADQFWNQDSSGVDDTAGTAEHFGEAIATGDFNGDSCDDLAIGVPNEQIIEGSGIPASGVVHVLYGSNTGLQTSSPADQFWHQDSANVEDTAEGNDHFGEALATGDFNLDGFADLAIGVPDEDVGAVANAGAVNVIYGSFSGLSATGAFIADQFWTQDSSSVLDTAEDGDNFGQSLIAGDFNNDGADELAIGVPNEDENTLSTAGSVNVLYGTEEFGLQANLPPDQFWHQNISGVEGSAAASENFGEALAAGDFNNDAYDDLAIGTPDDGEAGTIAGAVNVIYGSASGLHVSTALADQLWHQNSANVDETAAIGDNFGQSLAAGDFNGDGFVDIAIGVPDEDVANDSISNGGLVNVIYGSSSGLSPTAVLADQVWWQNAAGVEDVAEADDNLGEAVTVGNFNQDAYIDIAIGVPFEDVGAVANAGAVNVIYGSASGLHVSAEDLDQVWTQNSADMDDSSEDGDHFGQAL